MPSKLSVLHVIAGMDPEKGGVGQALRTIVKGLSGERIDNEIVCLDSNKASFLANETAVIHATGPGQGPWCISREMKTWLAANINRFNVVIVHGVWLYNGYAARKVWTDYIRSKQTAGKANTQPRLYVMPHGMLDPYFQKPKGRKIKALRNWVYWRLIENKLIHAADGLLFTCLTEMELARQPFRPYHPKKEYVVGLGVEAPPLYTTSMSDALNDKCPGLNGQPYLLFLSRIHEKKGVDILINAYGLLRKKHQILPKLVIAGPGLDSNFGIQMQTLINEKGLGEQIHLTGMLSGDAKWGAFYGCQAFTLPSHQENFGIAVVEALACAKPVLISNQVNIWKEIVNQGAGLVADDSIEGFEQLLGRWIQMGEVEKIKMCVDAQHCYNVNFAVKPAAKRLLDVISLQIDMQP